MAMNRATRSRRCGVSLIELLVAVYVIGVLMALLLMGVQAARDAARRMTCRHHLKQLALASLIHENAQGHLPTGGWGGAWVGDSSRGFGIKQPGGWTFNVLPYIEQAELHATDRGAHGAEKAIVIGQRLQKPLAILHCPARRSAKLYPLVHPKTGQARLSAAIDKAAKTDYAANAGDQERCEAPHFTGPGSLADGDTSAFEWPDMADATGVSFLRSRVRLTDIHDGTSNVYLLGEKSLNVDEYETGRDHGDDWSAYTGYQDDTYRVTSSGAMPHQDFTNLARPYIENCHFGSPHQAGWHAAFCDGSVRVVSYSVSASVHSRLGNREDGLPVTLN